MKIPARHHKGSDGWGRDSYPIPGTAVLGSSDTGMWDDSPCKSTDVKRELNAFRKVLAAHGITGARYRFSRTGNIFCAKRWLCVAPEDWERAITLADEYLEEHDHELRHVHGARN